ncbi:MAG: V4R domain-containing protein [Candidatus Heimdallarchaeota archaeon]
MNPQNRLEIQVESSIHQKDLKNIFNQILRDLPLKYHIEFSNGNRNHVTAKFQGKVFYSAKFSPKAFLDAFWQCITQEARNQLHIDEIPSQIKRVCFDASANMMGSLMGINPIMPGLSDYIHISNIQIRNFILLSQSRHMCELLFDLGKIAGKYGGFIGFFEEPHLKARSVTVWEHFQTALRGLVDFYSRTSDIGLNITKKAVLYGKSSSVAILRLFELPAATGVPDIGIPTCYLDAGLIAGIVETFIGTPVVVNEICCWGLGNNYCDFRIRLDENPQSTEILSRSTHNCWEFHAQKVLHSLIRSEHLSIRKGRKIRYGISDYVHFSLFQLFFSTLASIENYGPFLLVSAGRKHGRSVATLYGKNGALSLDKAFETTKKLSAKQKLLSGGHYEYIELLKDKIILYDRKTQLKKETSQPQPLYFYEVGFFSGLLSELTKTDLWLVMDINTRNNGYCELEVEHSSPSPSKATRSFATE